MKTGEKKRNKVLTVWKITEEATQKMALSEQGRTGLLMEFENTSRMRVTDG